MNGARGVIGDYYCGRGFDFDNVAGEIEVGVDLEAEFGREEKQGRFLVGGGVESGSGLGFF